MALLLMQSDKLMLSKLLPLRQYGYYMLASTVAGGLSALVGPLSNTSYPRLAELVARDDTRLVASAYHRFSQALSIVLTPAALMLAIFSERILTLWTHNPQTAAISAPFTSLLAVGYFFNGVMHNPYNLQLAYGWTRFFAVTNLIATIVFLPAIFFGISSYGAIAAAYIWICINASYLLFAIPLMHRKLLRHELSTWYVTDLLLPSAAAFILLEAIHYAIPLPPLRATGANLVFLASSYACTLAAAAAAAPLGRLTLVNLYSSARRLVIQFV
jgi:O-antigen/teichoic acid export membrane protein